MAIYLTGTMDPETGYDMEADRITRELEQDQEARDQEAVDMLETIVDGQGLIWTLAALARVGKRLEREDMERRASAVVRGLR